MDPARAPSPADELSASTTLIGATRDVKVRVIQRLTDGLVAIARGRNRLHGPVRLRVDRGPGFLILAEVESYVISYPVDGVETELRLRYVAIFSPSEPVVLTRFVTDILGAEPGPSNLTLCASGSACVFARNPASDQESLVFRRRSEPRAPVRVPARWNYVPDIVDDSSAPSDKAGAVENRRAAPRSARAPSDLSATHAATVYNVSGAGIYVLTEAPLPTRGDMVTITVPLPDVRPSAATTSPGSPGGGVARVTGEITWLDPHTETGGGFCVRIHSVDDGDRGHQYAAWVQDEARFAGALTASG